MCYTYLWTYFIAYTFDKKKETKDEKRNIVTRKVTEWCDEWTHSNQHDQLCACCVLLTIHRKVAQLVPWLVLEKSRYLRIATSKLAEINGIQKPRLHLWHWYMFYSQEILVYIKRGHFFVAQFFLGHPVLEVIRSQYHHQRWARGHSPLLPPKLIISLSFSLPPFPEKCLAPFPSKKWYSPGRSSLTFSALLVHNAV